MAITINIISALWNPKGIKVIKKLEKLRKAREIRTQSLLPRLF